MRDFPTVGSAFRQIFKATAVFQIEFNESSTLRLARQIIDDKPQITRIDADEYGHKNSA
jgi:hypothetical protein